MYGLVDGCMMVDGVVNHMHAWNYGLVDEEIDA